MPSKAPAKKGFPYWTIAIGLVVLAGYFILIRRKQSVPAPQPVADNTVQNQSATQAPSQGSGGGGASLPAGINASMFTALAGLGTNQTSTGQSDRQSAKQAKKASHPGVYDKPPYTNSKYQPGGEYYKTGLGRDPATGNTYADNPNWHP